MLTVASTLVLVHCADFQAVGTDTGKFLRFNDIMTSENCGLVLIPVYRPTYIRKDDSLKISDVQEARKIVN